MNVLKRRIFEAMFLAASVFVFGEDVFGATDGGDAAVDFSEMPQESEMRAKNLPVKAIPADISSQFPDLQIVEISFDEDCDSFLIGEDTQTAVELRFVKPFRVNRFETTYRLWYEVRILAERQGYVFANPGQEGSAGRRGKLPTDAANLQPVTAISWCDAIVWCNALSELEGVQPVYRFRGEVLRNSFETAKCDLVEFEKSADGYRLLTESEWEYSARKTESGAMQPGDFPSGVVSVEQNLRRAGEDVAWFENNCRGTKTVGTAEKANALGLFDMSGNVLEFCWDWCEEYQPADEGLPSFGPKYGYERVCRGGSWSPYASFILAGDRYSFMSDEAYNYLGFRLARNGTAATEQKTDADAAADETDGDALSGSDVQTHDGN